MSDFYHNGPHENAPFIDEERPGGGADRWQQPGPFSADIASGPMDEAFSAQRRTDQTASRSFLMEEPAPYGAEMQQGGVPLFGVEGSFFGAQGSQIPPQGMQRRVGRVARYQEEAASGHPAESAAGLAPPLNPVSLSVFDMANSQTQIPLQGQQRRVGRVGRYQEEAAPGPFAESAVGLAPPASLDPFQAGDGEVESPFSVDQGDAPTRIGMPVISRQMVNRRMPVDRGERPGPAPQLFREAPDFEDNQTLPQGRQRRSDRVARYQEVAAPVQPAQSMTGLVPTQSDLARMRPAQAVPIQPGEAVAVATAVPQPLAMNTAPPYSSEFHRATVYATPQASFASPGDIAEDWDDDDLDDGDVAGVFRQTPQPVPVPAYFPYEEEDEGHSGFVTFLLTLTMLISLAVVYFTGVADEMLAKVGIPVWKELTMEADVTSATPQVFDDLSAGAEGSASQANAFALTPASASGTPMLKSMNVEPSESTSPTTLLFTLESNSAAAGVQLRNETGDILVLNSSTSTPFGDGIRWDCTLEFEEPYQGLVAAYLTDGSGNWSPSNFSCQIHVK